MNFDLIAETDGDLRILRFIDFHNEEGYSVEPYAPDGERTRVYSITDASPIPFWLNANAHIIQGDRQPHDVDQFQRALGQSSILDDIKDLLTKARSGYFHDQVAQWEADGIRSTFPDVFKERPINSRYWIKRYRSAILNITQHNTTPQFVLDDLRNVGTRWLELFATKSDIPNIISIFGDGSDGVFSDSDTISSLFAVLIHQIANESAKKVYKFAISNPIFLAYFPRGLYFHWTENGYPNVPFKYSKIDDLLYLIRPLLHDITNSSNFKSAKQMALLLFGVKEDLPIALQSSMRDIRYYWSRNYADLRQKEDKIRVITNKSVEVVRRDFQISYNDIVYEIKNAFAVLQDLESIEYGNARLSPRKSDWYSVEESYINDLQLYEIEDFTSR